MLDERASLIRRTTVLESSVGKKYSVWGMENQKHKKKKFCVLEVIKKGNRITKGKFLGQIFIQTARAGDYPKGRWHIIVQKGYFRGWR